MFFFHLPPVTSNAACARFRLGRKRLASPTHPDILTLSERLRTITVIAQFENDALTQSLCHVRAKLTEISAMLLLLPVGTQSLHEQLSSHLLDQVNSMAQIHKERIHSFNIGYNDIRTLIRASTLHLARKPP